MRLTLFTAALAASLAFCTEPAHSQGRSWGDEPICNFEQAPRVSDADLERLALTEKLASFKEAIKERLKESDPKVVVVMCDDQLGDTVIRKFDENASKPRVISAVYYVPLKILENY